MVDDDGVGLGRHVLDLRRPTPDDVVNATLDGFEPAHVPVSRAARIVLEIAHATESTTVVASVLTSSGAAMETLGSRMTAQLA